MAPGGDQRRRRACHYAIQFPPIFRGAIQRHGGLGLTRLLHKLGCQPLNGGNLGRGKAGPSAAEEEFPEQVVITKDAVDSRSAFGKPLATVEFVQQLAG